MTVVVLPNVSQVQSVTELHAALRLRYDVFARYRVFSSGYANDRARMDLDEYDASSIHFVARFADESPIVATVRIITPRRQPHSVNLICRLAHRHGDHALRSAVDAPRDGQLLLFESWPAIELERATGVPIARWCEMSRLAVVPTCRGRGVARAAAERAVAAARDRGFAVICLTCGVWLVDMYRRMGFEPVPTAVARPFRGQPSNAMYLTL